MASSKVVNLKSNRSVLVYTDYGSIVRKTFCSLCLATKNSVRVNKQDRFVGKDCERCGKKSDSVVF